MVWLSFDKCLLLTTGWQRICQLNIPEQVLHYHWISNCTFGPFWYQAKQKQMCNSFKLPEWLEHGIKNVARVSKNQDCYQKELFPLSNESSWKDLASRQALTPWFRLRPSVYKVECMYVCFEVERCTVDSSSRKRTIHDSCSHGKKHCVGERGQT